MKIVCQTVGKVTTEILGALLVICSGVTTLHSCYLKMHPFSANQTRVKCSNRAGDNQSRSRILLYFWLSVKLHVVFSQISLVHCASTLDFDIAKRWNFVGQN